MSPPRLLRPERRRAIEHPFGWVPFRLLTGGFLAALTPAAQRLYFLLCLVADRSGVSYYGDPRVQRLLQLSVHELQDARHQLVELDLVAFGGRVYQLLSLPDGLESHRSRARRSVDRGPQSLGSVLRQLQKEG